MSKLQTSDISLFRQLFFHRQDVYAEMFKRRQGDRAGEIGYSPACSNRWDKVLCNHGKCRQCRNFAATPLTDEVVMEHFRGEDKSRKDRTIGTYLVSPQGTVNLCVLDIDIDKAQTEHIETYRERVKELACQLYGLAKHHGLNPVLEFSGNKGWHIWMFFDSPILAAKAQALGNWLAGQAEHFEGLHVETFPKQEAIDQFGNLVKVPLGIHLKTGKRCYFADPVTLEVNTEDQLDILRAIKPVPADTIAFLFEEYELSPKHLSALKSNNGSVPKGARLPCVPKMWGGVNEGCRDEVAFRLAVHLYKQGMPQVFAENTLVRWDNDYNDPPMGDPVIVQKVSSAYTGKYGYGCSSELIKPFCDPSCPVYKRRQEPEPVEEEEVRASAELRFLKIDPADSSMVFCRVGLEYRCSGTDTEKEGTKATVELRQGERTIHKDRLGLAVANRRKGYAKECIAVNPELDYQAILNDLAQLDGLIRQKQAEIFAEEAAAKTAEYVMSVEEEQAALVLLRSPKLLYQALQMIEKIGVVGENENKLVVFLGYTSRILSEPIQIYIKGESSSGKSFVSRKVLGLIPKESYIELTDMTPQALFYMQDTDLSHKIILLFERHGSEKADYAIRTGVSEGELSIAVPIKDPNTNRMKTERLVVKGPFMFLTTTTDAFLNPENETRNISLYSDDSEKQTVIIRDAEIERFLLTRKEVTPAELLVWQNAHRLLESRTVRVPYVRDIADKFPKKPVRVRRDFTRFIHLIRTVTILHQFQRSVLTDGDGDQFLDATIGDYYIAKKLAEKIFAKAVIEIGPKAIEVWAHCFDEKYEKQDAQTNEKTLRVFTYASIAKAMEWKVVTVKKWVGQLSNAGYINWTAGEDDGGKKRGRPQARFTLTEKEYSDMSVLPEVSELVAKYPALSTGIYDPFTGEEPDDVLPF